MPPDGELKGTLWVYTDDIFCMFKSVLSNSATGKVTGVIYAERGANTKTLIRMMIPHLRDEDMGRAYPLSSSDQYTAFSENEEDGGLIALTSREYWKDAVSELKGLPLDQLRKIHPIMPLCPKSLVHDQYYLMKHSWTIAWIEVGIPEENIVDWTATLPMTFLGNLKTCGLPADVTSPKLPCIYSLCYRDYEGRIADTCQIHLQLGGATHHITPQFTQQLLRHIMVADKDGVLATMNFAFTVNLGVRSLNRALTPKLVKKWMNEQPYEKGGPSYFYANVHEECPVYETFFRK